MKCKYCTNLVKTDNWKNAHCGCEIKILNVGCGNQIYGTDRIDIVQTDTTTLVYDIEKGLPYEDNSFNEVYCSYVWEHIKNPYNLLLEMKRVCKEGGYIEIITDNAGYILTHTEKFGRTLHGNYKNEVYKEDKHYQLFTEEHLKNIFESAGIRVIETDLIYWKNISSKKSKLVHKILNFFLGKRYSMPSVRILGAK